MLLLVGLAFAQTGCGTAKTSQTVVDGSSGDLTKAMDCGGAAALADDPPVLRRVPSDTLEVKAGTAVKSMCDLMRGTGKKVTVFQFASVTCYSCLKWIDQVNAGVTADAGLTKDVLPVVVLTDLPATLSDGSLDKLKAEVAPGATWVRDDTGDLWHFFSPSDDPAQGTQPLAVVMDRFSRGFYVSDTAKSAKDLADAANQLMQLDVGK